MPTLDSILGLSDFVVRPTGVLLLAAAVTLAMGRRSAASRHLVWSAALCAVLAVPLVGPIAPDVAVPLDSRVTALIEHAPFVQTADPDGVDRARQAESASPATRATRAPEASAVRLAVPWRWIWLAGCLGLAVVLGGRLLTLRQVERNATLVDAPGLLTVLDAAKRRLNVERPVRLLFGAPSAMPMTWGHRSPRILLPSTAAEWPSERTRAVLLHELAHVGRGDVLLQRIAELARAVFWFNPLAWYATRRMLVEREHACDDAVIRSGVRGSEYAHQLLAMTHSLRSARGAAAALPMARRSQMTGRLMAILDEERSRRSPPALGARPAFAVGIVAALAVAALRPVPAAAIVGGEVPAGGDGSGIVPAQEIADSWSSLSGCWDPLGSNTNSNRNHDPGVITAEWRTSRCEGGLRIEGRAVVRPDLRGFAHLDPGTRVKIGEKEGDVWRKLELVGGSDGRIDRRGSFGDRRVGEREVDAWLASNLRPLLRLTGVELEVARGSP